MKFSRKEVADAAQVRFFSTDLKKNITVETWLTNLLETLLVEEESFSGKRPFGSSAWQNDVEIAFIKAGLVEGKLDENGCVEEYNLAKGGALLCQVAKSLRCCYS